MSRIISQLERDAFSIYDPLTTFLARWEVYNETTRARVRELLDGAFGADDRQTEAAVGQFLAQLDHIISQRGY